MSPVFPAVPPDGWAWPKGQHHRLLFAVLSQDEAAAAAAARAWLDANDIDAATFREHRLLAAMAQRLGAHLAGHPAHGRLAGLSRHLWARSLMARRATMPAVGALAAAMPVMLLKGVSRAAVDPGAGKGRVGHDIDVLVPPGRMGEAMDILLAAGWAPDQSASARRLRAQAGWLRAVNLYRGNLGDIDLHQRPYRGLHQCPEDDRAIWTRARPVRFEDLDLLVPSAADRAALAIAHGAADGHSHSDWLVDAAVAMRDPGFDAARFEEIVGRRRLEVLAAPCLGYLAAKIGIALPDGLSGRLSLQARRRPLLRLAALALAKPGHDPSPSARLVQRVLRPLRRRLTRDARPPAAAGGCLHVRGRRLRSLPPPAGAGVLAQALPPQPEGAMRIVLRIGFDGPRRAEFELNAATGHLARLSFRNLRRAAHLADILFEVPVPPDAAGQPLELTARPLRATRHSSGDPSGTRFGAKPFEVIPAA